MNMKKMFLLNLPYLLFVYPFDKLAQAFRLAPGADLSGKLLSIGDGFTAALSSPWLSFHPTDLLIGIAGAVILRMAVYLKGKNAKKYRHGIEYGSARWGTAADIAPYMDKDFFQNIPMTQTERITMASRPKQPKYARNKNILVIGGSGSGKTRFFCKPSLLQAHSSYVCTDPKGTLLPEIGAFLERKKYCIKCLNLINFRKSMKYNPLAYIRSEKDILKLVNALIMNTKGEGEKSSEDFWVKAERLYYSALIGYIWYEATEEEKNFITLLDLINASEAREDQVPYDYYICTVTLENFDLSHVPVYVMGEDQLSRYAIYMATLGNRPDLFPDSPYVNKYITGKPGDYEVPGEYLDDEAFAAMLAEAQKYIGYPYVWGGSSPATSFDCSGYVSWVINHSGWNVGRLGAQGLYNICTLTSSPKPGDLVFFKGTYDTPGVSHCGIYVGDGKMLHCGDPIGYANLNTSYWQSHFYAYGRLP